MYGRPDGTSVRRRTTKTITATVFSIMSQTKSSRRDRGAKRWRTAPLGPRHGKKVRVEKGREITFKIRTDTMAMAML